MSLAILSDESDMDVHRLPVLRKHDPTSVPRTPPNSPLIASTPLPEDNDVFNTLKHEVEKASQTIVSRYLDESNRRLREEAEQRLNRRSNPRVVNTDAGGQVEPRVAGKSSLRAQD